MRVKKFLVLVVFLFLGTATGAAQTIANFAGEWDWLDEPDKGAFYLKIEQEGNQIWGSYCALAFQGSRVDCGFEEGACAIAGVVHGQIAEVEFTSCYGGKTGRARLIHHGETIEWVIREPPVGRWYFAPQKAILEKRLQIW